MLSLLIPNTAAAAGAASWALLYSQVYCPGMLALSWVNARAIRLSASVASATIFSMSSV